MMRDAILGFASQFAFEPKIVNSGTLRTGAGAGRPGGSYERYIVAGMGGSHLAADLLKTYDPTLPVLVHSDYGLPGTREQLKASLIIASSYSGNTEETIDVFTKARECGLAVAAVATGERLFALAKESGVPYVELPKTGIQPRSALGFSFKAFLALLGLTDVLGKAAELQTQLDPKEFENAGSALAKQLNKTVPIIYASTRNRAIAYNWKIKLNETGKMPAFCNVFPELNHNEMTGFDRQGGTKDLSKNFSFVFLKDESDYPQVRKRMEVTERLYRDRKLPVIAAPLAGKNQLHKMFSALVLADWVAYYAAAQYKVESEQIPMIEELKRLIR